MENIYDNLNDNLNDNSDNESDNGITLNNDVIDKQTTQTVIIDDKKLSLIDDAKKNIIVTILKTVNKKISDENFREVYRSDKLFDLLSDSIINNYIKKIACGENDDKTKIYSFFQYKHFGKIVNIIVDSSNDDLELANEIIRLNFRAGSIKLVDDIKTKFSSMKFFEDYEEAYKYIKSISGDVIIKFIKSNKTEKNDESMSLKYRFPNQNPPSSFSIFDVATIIIDDGQSKQSKKLKKTNKSNPIVKP
jgi:hypothetical protein